MILIAGPSLKTCIEMALEAVCEKDGRIFLFIYLYFFCLCYHPSTINFISLTSLCCHLLAWSNSDLTLSLHTPTLQLLYCFLCLLISFISSSLPSNPLLFIFCLIFCSHFTIHLPFPLLNFNIFVYVYHSIHVFWSSHFPQISFLSI